MRLFAQFIYPRCFLGRFYPADPDILRKTPFSYGNLSQYTDALNNVHALRHSMSNKRHPQRRNRFKQRKKPSIGDIEFTREQLVAILDATKPEWTPFEKMPDIVPAKIGADEGWVNSRYQVWIYRPDNPRSANDWNAIFETEGEFPRFTQLSIRSLANDHYAHDWRDLQRIKNELIHPEAEALELYPSMKRLVDTSNQFHLWVIEGDGGIPVGWPQPDVIHKEDVEALLNGSRQRAFEEGFLGDYESELIRNLTPEQKKAIQEVAKDQQEVLDR